ncbi:hypothetical protein CR201_G0012929 [Pongo abelii]|uniref:Uncharacterized protein n=1 Tax=Pongo abelii TaxID=9601 RepID=A0A2J8W576_PONAB|nr:hypothetical protein CR201_G0012929 [Pongo abelii]
MGIQAFGDEDWKVSRPHKLPICTGLWNEPTACLHCSWHPSCSQGIGQKSDSLPSHPPLLSCQAPQAPWWDWAYRL